MEELPPPLFKRGGRLGLRKVAKKGGFGFFYKKEGGRGGVGGLAISEVDPVKRGYV